MLFNPYKTNYFLRELKQIKKVSFKGYGVEVKPVTPKDLIYLRKSRNSVEVRSQMVDTSYITASKQRLWYENMIKDDSIAYWVVWQRGYQVGSMNIRVKSNNNNKHNIDVGMYVWSQKYNHGLLGTSIALVQLDLVFYYLNLSSVETSPKKHNKRAIVFNKKLGYIKINEDSEYVHIRMDKNRYEQKKQLFNRYFKKCNILEVINH